MASVPRDTSKTAGRRGFCSAEASKREPRHFIFLRARGIGDVPRLLCPPSYQDRGPTGGRAVAVEPRRADGKKQNDS